MQATCQWCNTKKTIYTKINRTKPICRSCFASNTYFKCWGCSAYFEHLFLCSLCITYLCNICISITSKHDHEDAYRNVTIEPFLKGKEKGKVVTINRLVGCEIEAEGGKRSPLFNILHKQSGITSDGSLGRGGTEVQTPPASLDVLEQIVTNTTEEMTKSGFAVSPRCGLHVHIDVRKEAIDMQKLCHLFKTFYIAERFIYPMLTEKRKIGSYSRPLANKWAFTDFNEKMNEDEFSCKFYKTTDKGYIVRAKQSKGGGDRYFGLNLQSVFYRGTIEFRYHQGSLDGQEILQWVQLLLLLITYAVSNFNEKDLLFIQAAEKNTLFVERAITVLNLSSLQPYILSCIKAHHPTFFTEQEEKAKKEAIMREQILSALQQQQTATTPGVLRERLLRDLDNVYF